jgi:hypothetical protein
MSDDIEQRTVRPFADFLREQRKGSLHAELSEVLQELNLAVAEHQKGGKVTLTITIAPLKNQSGNMVVVTDDVTAKIPQADRGAAYFYTDADGNLRREDPDQMSFDSLREVEAPGGDLVAVDANGEIKEIVR